MTKLLTVAFLLLTSPSLFAAPTVSGNTLSFPPGDYYWVYDITDWSTYACTVYATGPDCTLPAGDYQWFHDGLRGDITLDGPAATPFVSYEFSYCEWNLDFVPPPTDGIFSCNATCPTGSLIGIVGCTADMSYLSNGEFVGGPLPTQFSRLNNSSNCRVIGSPTIDVVSISVEVSCLTH